MTDPQEKYYDDQNILDIDFDQMHQVFIQPIDAIRSHFNALQPGSEELNTPEFQESRCHAFYRMIGFPIVADANNFYSPGFDPNLNTDSASIKKYEEIAKNISNNQVLTGQFAYRELIPISLKRIFSDGGTNSQAVALGSIFIREFDKQLANTDTDPLADDPSKTQIIDERFSEVAKYFSNVSNGILISNHQLKPFIVDPRIDSSVRPIKNRICAPFLIDKSQTKIFQSQEGSSDNLKRPFIEKVISVRFNNRNVTKSSDFITNIIDNISVDEGVKDQKLLDVVNNTLSKLHDSELSMFENYYKLLRVIIKKLVFSIRQIQEIRQRINWKPLPDPKNGPESGTNGGKLPPIDPEDKTNTKVELEIINITRLKALDDIDFDAGLQGTPDPGDFAFSDLDDLVGSAHKDVKKSHEELLNKLTTNRDYLGNQGIDFLKNIEMVMGEFSGIGLVDIISIQAALWVMEPSMLLGLIDERAFTRINSRKDINLNGLTQASISDSLKEFEKQLNNIYYLVQKYYNNLNNGEAHSI